MKKRILSLLLCCAMLLGLLPTTAFAEGSNASVHITGSGASDDPYLIYTAAELSTFRDLASLDPFICAKLMNDINLGGEQWTPIGNSDVYRGIFDGNGKTISGLNVTGVKNAGLFGKTIEATIRNLAVDGTVSGLNYAGGIVGTSDYGTTIEGCVNLCRVSASDNLVCAGGIVGYLNYIIFSSQEPPNSIKNCANFGEISVGGADYGIYAGGIVGCMDLEDNPITGCYSVGKVSSSSKGAHIGGICGSGIKDRSYYLIDTVQGDFGYSATTKAEFANDVLALLQNGDENSPWEKCGYLSAAGMIVPLLKGQTADTFPIYTAEDLETFRDMVNSGESGANAMLMNDIDLGGEAWTPIGNYTGTFDGNGKTVSGLNVKNVINAGLFGTLNDATVKNVTVTGNVAASETGKNAYAGAIAAYATGSTTITGCKNYATVTTTTAAGKDVNITYKAYAGGTVGYATGSVALTDCVNNGTVLSTIRNNDDFSVEADIGGIAGTADGNIRFESCVNNGALSTDCKSAESNIGGIVGFAIGGAVIADCQNNGAVTGAVDHSEDPDIYYMFYTTNSNAGGIVGCGVAIRITGCHNAGAIRSDSTGNYTNSTRIGGIAGFIRSDAEKAVITDCSNVAAVAGTNAFTYVRAGGIMGFVNSDSADVSFTNCYSTGAVSVASQKSEIGGIAGNITKSGNGGNIVIDNCYWLTGTVESAVGFKNKNPQVNASSESKADFADGTVLGLLKQNDTTNAWDVCGYVAAADMTLPLLKWQTLNARKYDIFIKSVQITSLNQNDVLGDGKVSFTYDEANKKGTLTLNGVNIVCNDLSDDYPIDASGIENLEIVLKGENNIEAEWVAGIMADNLTFSGSGSIEISTDGNYNWPVSCDKTFTVNGGNVKISSIDYALLLDGALTVNGGTLELIATDEYGYAIDIGRNKLNVVLGDDRIMITGTNPDGSDARITAASEVDTIKAARYVKILSKYIPIVYEPGQYGTGSAITQNKTYGEDFGLSDALFTRTGYTQVGWALSDGGDKTYALGSAYTGSEPLTLYPVWEAEQYSITYDPNGGTIGSGNVTGYTYGVGATLPTDVTRTGYTFNGWYDNAAFSGTAVTLLSDTDSGNKTYYAKWTENDNYIVIFISDGGTLANDKKTVKWTDKVLDGVTDPTRNGYIFAGWKYVDTDVTPNTTYADLAVNDTVASVTLTAQWLDVAAPTGEIKIAENGWKSFLNTITFGLFFKDTQTVTVTAGDNSGEAVTIEYLLSDQALTETELAGMPFTAYSAPFSIDPDNAYVIYAKLTDTSGNVAYINTDGIVLDATVPVISGIEAGKTYCAAQTVTVTEKYIDTVTVNGTEVSLDENGQFILSPASGEQTVVVTDMAGNKTAIVVTVNDGHTGGEATCTEKAKCEVCGESYGERNANNHADLKHIEAKAATKTAQGNIEYWYCTACGKYFADRDGRKEITKADTVTAKLPAETKPAATQPQTKKTAAAKSPQTGAQFLPLLGAALALLGGLGVAGKKKREDELRS